MEQAIRVAKKAKAAAERAEYSAKCSESTAKNAGTARAMKRRILEAISTETMALAAESDLANQVGDSSVSEDKETQAEIEQLARLLRADED